MKKIFPFFVFIGLLTACNPIGKILNGGNIQQTDFIEKIPFTFNNFPVVKVNIDGKNYNFLFDTGAPTVISPELMSELKLKTQNSSEITDSQDNKQQERYVIVPSIKIGSLVFENVGAVVIDLKQTFDFKCLNFDGIIGANQMAKAIWQIDYKNKILTATNKLSNLNIPDYVKTINFIPKKNQKTPLVPVEIGNIITYVTFDTGFSGDMFLSSNHFKNEILDFKKVESIGSVSAGVYGKNKSMTSSYVKVKSLTLGNLQLEDQIFEFRETLSGLVGNSLFKNYRVIINWSEKKIYMIKESNFNETKLDRFGITIQFIDNKAMVGKILKGSDAEKLGILLMDHIISIDGLDTSKFTEEQACYYTLNSILNGKKEAILTILRNGEKINFKLKKSVFLE